MNQRSVLLPSVLALGIFFIVTCSATFGQASDDGASSASIWQSVLKTFASGDAESLTLAKAKESEVWEFFPQSSKLYQDEAVWSAHFRAVDGPHKATGRLLSLEGRSVQRGDVIVLENSDGNKSRRLVLVYAGEHSFNDAPSTKLSFFVYPYRSRLEFNTYPPRLHRQMLENMELSKVQSTESPQPTLAFLKFSKPHKLILTSLNNQAGSWYWLQSPKSLGDPPLFFPAELWKQGAIYRILRPARSQSLALFLKEVRKMPCHRQLHPTKEQRDNAIPAGGTCFWQAYSDTLAYSTRDIRPISQESVLRYERSLVKKYLEDMSPQDNQELQQMFLETTFAQSLTQMQRQQRIQSNEQWEFWLGLDKNLNLARDKLKMQFRAPEHHDAFIQEVEKALRDDKPVLVDVVYHVMDHVYADAAEKKLDGEPFTGVIRAVKQGEKRQAGHYVVIVGMIRDASGKVLLYFQDGHYAGDEPGNYTDAEYTEAHIVKIDSEVFWEKSVRHANNNPFVTRSGAIMPPVALIGN